MWPLIYFDLFESYGKKEGELKLLVKDLKKIVGFLIYLKSCSF